MHDPSEAAAARARVLSTREVHEAKNPDVRTSNAGIDTGSRRSYVGVFCFVRGSVRRRTDPHGTGQIGAIRARRAARVLLARSSFLRSSFRLTRKDRRGFAGVCLDRLVCLAVCLVRRAHDVHTLSRKHYETRLFMLFCRVERVARGAHPRTLHDRHLRSPRVQAWTI